ncbi:hypothetical protein [Pantoea sp. Aalb]|uniref:hypothetical protein n=1 Tax=Pantoea sp. Aalb TaxID=2576762 RepID=UPI00132463F0|nr:hypothetical protein [Pantoea sp. Aalb]MXP68011.1 hypothetical protein [Pantoea sp. Aalb]
MSEIALMFFKPEFNIFARKYYFPLIHYYLKRYQLNIERNIQVYSYKKKAILFDEIYSEILNYSYQSQLGSTIGSFEYLKKFKNISDLDLFKQWNSLKESILKIGKDQYFIQNKEFKILNPFCPYQRKMFINIPVSIHLFIIKKKSFLSWIELKSCFQGAPIQKNSYLQGIRSYLSHFNWYTPTTNGIHLSATDDDAINEIKIVDKFFTN